MIKRIASILAIPSVMLIASCATTNQTAQQVDQHDDVYYSVAEAREEIEVIAQAKPAAQSKNYVTDEQLYGDAYSESYSGDYSERIYRFRNYAPWRGYYGALPSSYYGMYNYYDPFYNPYSFFGGPGVNVSIGIGNGFYNNLYNPWRYYGFNNYGSNFWGPYSYYNAWNPWGVGYGNYLGGYYGGGYNPIYVSPNYRARPGRSSNNPMIDRMGVNGDAAGAIIRPGNGATVPSRGTRAERYNGGNSSTPSTSGRTQTTQPRPARVSQSQPERVQQPERVNRAPQQVDRSSGGQQSGGGRSNDSGGSSSGSSRPSRGN